MNNSHLKNQASRQVDSDVSKQLDMNSGIQMNVDTKGCADSNQAYLQLIPR